MNGAFLIPAFLAGLLGSAHCVGMCGGIITAFSAARLRRFPVPVVATTGTLSYALSYNSGRIVSYSLAGAIAGGISGGISRLTAIASFQHGLYWAANLMLVALGLYFMDAWRGLARVEAAGAHLWSHVKPVLKPLVPADTAPKAFALGMAWGWVPCAMVYSVLLTALTSGSALTGAATMAAFGAGTLPALLSVSLGGAALAEFVRRPRVRQIAGLVLISFAVLGMYRAVHGLSLGWIDALCIAPGAHS
ncbi:sulfite exporter TauE/SafE family protein [Massilia sp. TS11]|uniref:sulfite exporter TauE/SafE family protein n=1 Tax=Massilia sp. TS11 TaxID=2908003 RepID=UPI001EDC095D|nr:sulfite exporter TauE/SafE family protein [Massilia sp. TS11]MCG2583989.1 sulfite exporter TauE/SafE family protein [Massilia sp. TS11]